MHGFVTRASRAGALLGGLCLVSIVVLTVAEILTRRLLGRSIGPVHEISAYLFAAGVSMSFAYAFVQRAHIRIDILYGILPRFWRDVLDLLALVSLFLFAGALLMRGWSVFAISWTSGSRSNSTLGLPLVIPQGVWLAGLAIFCAVLLFYCVIAIRRFVGGGREWIGLHLSPPNTKEIVDHEMRGVAARDRGRGE